MILEETRYSSHDDKLLAIIKLFKTLHLFIKRCKHDVFVLIDCNNMYHFLDMKNLNSNKYIGLMTHHGLIIASIVIKSKLM